MGQMLTTSKVARILGSAVKSVANWIDAGQLPAGRTPGGHRRVDVDDLVAFLRRQNLPVPPELATAQPKVLVVDDDLAATELVAATLAATHPEYSVLRAHDGFAAGEVIGAEKPHVVILDLRMPGLDGFEVCRRIKERPDTRDIEVIAVTGVRSPKEQQRIVQCGARTCLPKPLDLQILVSEIESALTARR